MGLASPPSLFSVYFIFASLSLFSSAVASAGFDSSEIKLLEQSEQSE